MKNIFCQPCPIDTDRIVILKLATKAKSRGELVPLDEQAKYWQYLATVSI